MRAQTSSPSSCASLDVSKKKKARRQKTPINFYFLLSYIVINLLFYSFNQKKYVIILLFLFNKLHYNHIFQYTHTMLQ